MNNRKKQRECPNPLFLKWLEEWRDEAKQKNSKLQYTYGKVSQVLLRLKLKRKWAIWKALLKS